MTQETFRKRIEEIVVEKSKEIGEKPQNAIALGREIYEAIKALHEFENGTLGGNPPNKRYLGLIWGNTPREKFLEWINE